MESLEISRKVIWSSVFFVILIWILNLELPGGSFSNQKNALQLQVPDALPGERNSDNLEPEDLFEKSKMRIDDELLKQAALLAKEHLKNNELDSTSANEFLLVGITRSEQKELAIIYSESSIHEFSVGDQLWEYGELIKIDVNFIEFVKDNVKSRQYLYE